MFSLEEDIDCYEILQILITASFSDIKHSFRKLAKIYHPDNKETGSHFKFINIKKAYDILSDPVQRETYDTKYKKSKNSQKYSFNEEKEQFKKFYSEKLNNLSNEEKIKIVLLYADTNSRFKKEYIEKLRIKYFVLKMDLSTIESNSLNNIISGFRIDIDAFLQKLKEKPKKTRKKKLRKRRK